MNLVEGINHAIILQKQGYNIDWLKSINDIRNALHSDKSVKNWIARLEEYELLFTITKECIHQLAELNNQIYWTMDSYMEKLMLAGAKPDALERRKKILKEVDKHIPSIKRQLALTEDLLIYVQNYSLSSITGKRIPEREPKDPSLPRLYTDEQGYLQFEEGTEKN